MAKTLGFFFLGFMIRSKQHAKGILGPGDIIRPSHFSENTGFSQINVQKSFWVNINRTSCYTCQILF